MRNRIPFQAIWGQLAFVRGEKDAFLLRRCNLCVQKICCEMSLKIYTIGDKLMKNSVMEQIKQRIDGLPSRGAFVASDFTDIAPYQNAKKCLLRLEGEKRIRRVLRGVYDKPFFSSLLNEFSAPDLEEIAKAIARNYSWQIAPTGITSLNLLGLSTQVVSAYEYYSSGQYKSYEVGKMEIRFLHRSSKELLNLSYESAMVVSAIKELGVGIGDGHIAKIKSRLSDDGKARLLKESTHVTKWIYDVIKIICQ